MGIGEAVRHTGDGPEEIVAQYCVLEEPPWPDCSVVGEADVVSRAIRPSDIGAFSRVPRTSHPLLARAQCALEKFVIYVKDGLCVV